MASEIYPNKNRTYVAIDLKSFYASVECAERGLDPLTTNLVVADESRTAKTICLAVSPSLKAYGLSGRSRLFEVEQKAREILEYTGKPLEYIVAKPRMALYIDYSSRIYETYLDFVSHEDISVYSIDEVFIDVTDYLKLYNMSAHDLAARMVRAVLSKTGITATVGVASNLYLCKIAMDIVAKKMEPDEHGVRIAELDEQSYREQLWSHTPITDFWRIGGGYSRSLARYGMFTMGDVARMSLVNESLLYKLFGVNAELLIDHAWGYEPCTMREIKSYRPRSKSLSLGQVLSTPYDFEKARLIIREMADLLTLDLVKKGLLTDQVVLTVGYDIENISDSRRRALYHGEIKTDHYGRQMPKQAHGSENIGCFCSSTRKITEAVTRLFERIVNPDLLVRRMYIAANHTVPERELDPSQKSEQLSLFDLSEPAQNAFEAREKRIQQAILSLRTRYGKNAVLKGMNFREGATTRERNRQIGGHLA